MTGLEQMLSNPEGVTFTTLFVALFIYTIKTNGDREANYRETIKELTKALNTFDDLKEKVDEIRRNWEVKK